MQIDVSAGGQPLVSHVFLFPTNTGAAALGQVFPVPSPPGAMKCLCSGSLRTDQKFSPVGMVLLSEFDSLLIA